MYNFSEKQFEEVHSLLLGLLKVFRDICEAEGVWYTLAYGTVLGAVRHKGFIPWDADVDVCVKLCDVDKFRQAFYKHSPEGIVLNDRSRNPKNTKSHDTLAYDRNVGYPDIHLDIYPLVGAPEDAAFRKRYRKYSYNLGRIFKSKYVDISECLDKNKPIVFIVKMIGKLIPNKFIKANIHNRETKYDMDKSNYWMCLSCSYDAIPKSVWATRALLQFEDDEFYGPGDWDLYLKSLYGDYMTPRKS